jgi:hypothetical protein
VLLLWHSIVVFLDFFTHYPSSFRWLQTFHSRRSRRIGGAWRYPLNCRVLCCVCGLERRKTAILCNRQWPGVCRNPVDTVELNVMTRDLDVLRACHVTSCKIRPLLASTLSVRTQASDVGSLDIPKRLCIPHCLPHCFRNSTFQCQ